MQKLFNDLNTMQSIVSSMTGASPSPMMSTIEKKEVNDEVAILQAEIRKSCKKLLNIMTAEEVARVNINSVVQMFGEDKKGDIIALLRK